MPPRSQSPYPREWEHLSSTASQRFRCHFAYIYIRQLCPPAYFLPLRIGGATSTAVPTSEEKAGIRIGGEGEGINSARWVVAQCADLKVECEAPDGNRTRFETLSFVSSTPVLYYSIVFCYLSRTFAFFSFLEQSDVENSVVGLQN